MTSSAASSPEILESRNFSRSFLLVISFMEISGVLSRYFFFAGLSFTFISTTQLQLPVFHTLDKLFLSLSLFSWITSPGPLTNLYRGNFFLGVLALRREHWLVIGIFLSFIFIKCFDMLQRMIQGSLNVFGIFGYFIQEAPYILLPILLWVHSRSEKDIAHSIRIALASAAISSLVALGIYFDLAPIFLAVRDALVSPNSLYPQIGRLPFQHHQAGLANSAFIFSYHMSIVIPTSLFCYFSARSLLIKVVQASLLVLFLATLGVIGTRMPIIGCIVGILFGYSRMGKLRGKHIFWTLLMGCLVLSLFAAGGLAIQERFSSESLLLDFLDKFWAQSAAFLSLPSNPLGVGYGNVDANDYVNSLNADIRLVHLPHFHFITAILFWGFPGLAFSTLYCLSTWGMLRAFAKTDSVASMSPLPQTVVIVGVAGLISTLINGMAHNPGPFFFDYTPWLCLGWVILGTSIHKSWR